MSLSTQEQILIEQRVTNEAKSTAVAYLLWFFLGGLGAHRFYLGRSGSAIILLLLMVIGFILLPVGIGALPLIVAGIWLLVDAFLIPGMIQQDMNGLRDRLHSQVLVRDP